VPIDRRSLLIGGGAGVGLVVAWALWPRDYPANLAVAEGEHAFGAWLKIGRDGHVTVAVPQTEHGQGVYTALPQILADELGADWRTVGVEAAPLNPAYANPLASAALFGGPVSARGEALMLTAASTSVRMFEPALRQAGAAARSLLCQAAAARWGVDWRDCATRDGFVILGQQRLRFADLAEEAAEFTVPADVPPRVAEERLAGTPAPRLDAPAKVDGSANFAGDVRLPGMVFASIRQGPSLASRLVRIDRAAANRVPGAVTVVENLNWVAAIGSNWWAANRAVAALAPRFETPGPLATTASVDAALDAALTRGGARIGGAGEIARELAGGRLFAATYRTGASVHAPLEPVTATAAFDNGKLVLWMATQAPASARAAAAGVLGLSEGAVVLHPTMAGGSFGSRLEHRVAEQAALLARELRRPVQLTWSRAESLMHTPPRPPAAARMTARLAANGAIAAWRAQIAAPSVGRQLADRLLEGGVVDTLRRRTTGEGDRAAVAGAAPTYRLPVWAVDHHPADIGVPVGWWGPGADASSCFFTESFVDELARQSGFEPLSFRISMLGGMPRLARCLSTVASLGGWQGGISGSGQGIACHSYAGSHIALMAEAGAGEGGRPRVDRLVAAVDVGRAINPDLVVQSIERGLLFGLGAALGGGGGFADGMPSARRFVDLGFTRLASPPSILVELIESGAEPGGASDLAIPVVAPAVANALFAATGVRHRRTPLTEPT
jgi:isoquinoline 1-oxidoreductase beta subunit